MKNNVKVPASKWLLVLIAFVMMAAGLVGIATPAQAATGNILPPFAIGETWKIYQGYGPDAYSHNNNPGNPPSLYGLDLTYGGTDTSSGGKSVYAPVSGTIQGNPSTSPTGSICINMEDGRSVTLTHINTSITGGNVTAGQSVGTVATAGQKSNNGIAHIHFQMWSSSGCWGTGNGGIPFDDAHSARICGAADLVANGTSGTNGIWSGTNITGANCTSVMTIKKSDIAWIEPSVTAGQSNNYMIPSTGTGWGTAWTAGGWNNPSRVLAGDFTGDGKADLAWVEPSLSAGYSDLRVVPSVGTGWGAAWTAQTWNTPAQIAAGDFNGDGKADLLWVEPSSVVGKSNVYMIPSTGTGWGTAWTANGWNNPSQIATGDITGDSKADIVWVEPSSTSGKSDVYMIPSTGTGWGTAWTAGGWNIPSRVLIGDFNADSKSDLLWIEPSSILGKSNTYMIPSTGSGWGAAWSAGGWNNPMFVVIGDFSADGKSDILWVEPSATANKSDVYMIPSTGTGWGTAWTAGGWNIPTHVVAGDFNGD